MTRTVLAALAFVAGLSGLATAAAPDHPRLLIIISVDQFRGDYIERYGQQWTRGLRRLIDRGAYFPQAAYPYMNTVTCVGHATISTGTFPATHGIPLNAWWDRETGKQMNCTEDPQTQVVTATEVTKAVSHSAWRLRVPTFADELRVQSPVEPRIVTMSLKARSAVMLAGQRGDLVTWYDGERGFVTSSAFTRDPVAFLDRFQRATPIGADAGRTWDRSLPPAAYLFRDEGIGERPERGWGSTFPHAVPGSPGHPGKGFYTTWESTPFADAYLGKMAEAAVREFKLGQDDRTDYLAISFSVLDLVGHGFGPTSHEVQDVLASLDATIGRLLDELDRQLGPAGYLVALTADHGVSLIPEQVVEEGLSAGRIDGPALVKRINAALAPWAALLGPGPYIDTLIYTDLYFKPGIYQHLLQSPDALHAVTSTIESTPGVLRVLQSVEMANLHLGTDQLSLTAVNSYVPGRSGDMLIVPRPYFLNSTAATTHGTGYRYDARVPVILAGAGVKAGIYLSAATPADVIPTLAYVAGITMSRTDGRVLSEALAGAPDARSRRTGAEVTVPPTAHVVRP